MQTDPKTIESVKGTLEDLVDALTSVEAKIEHVDFDGPSPKAVLYIVPADGDYGRINGKDGSHFGALAAIIERISKAQGIGLELRLLEPNPIASRPDRTDPLEPAPAVELLENIITFDLRLEDASVRFVIRDGFHQFEVATRSPETYAALNERFGSVPLVAALGTLLRAAGKKAGKKYRLVITMS